MEDLAASLMSLSHSAPLYLIYGASGFKKHQVAAGNDYGCCDGGFEFVVPGKNLGNGDRDVVDVDAAPRACSSDVSAFADELFRGSVLLPLKLPPRLQRPASTSSAGASAAASPTARAPSSASRSPFALTRRHTGFDPFAAALEKVRRDGGAPPPRRARSLSPLRGAAAMGPAGSSGRPRAPPRPAGAAATGRAAARPPWWKKRGLRHVLCRAVMATAAAPRALRRRRGLLVCFRL